MTTHRTEHEPIDSTEAFEYVLRTFLDCVRAIATSGAEGRPFNYFLAHEYLWELQNADPWVIDSSASYLSNFEKAAVCRFIESVPDAKEELQAAQKRHPDDPNVSALPAWPDWRNMPMLPAWSGLSMRALTLMNQLEAAATRNDAYFASLGINE